jgi:hypothetical protein
LTDPEQYDKGVTIGRILERMTKYDTHFAEINGSVKKTGERLGKVEDTLDRILSVMVNASESVGVSEAHHDRADHKRGQRTEWARAAALVGALNFAVLLLILILVLR